MLQPVRWLLVFVVIIGLTTITTHNVGVQAQDPGVPNPAIGTDTSATPSVTVGTPEMTKTPTEAATLVVTEAVTVPPVATTMPGVSEAVPTPTPVLLTPNATTTATVSIVAPADLNTTTTPSSSSAFQKTSTGNSSAPRLPSNNATHDREVESSLQGSAVEDFTSGSEATSASFLPSPSSSSSDTSTGFLNGLPFSKKVILFTLGGVGLIIITSLLFVLWRYRRRKHTNMGTLTTPDTTGAAMSSIAKTTRDFSSWKASESSFTSRDLPLSGRAQAKLDKSLRSSIKYDMVNQHSQIASLPVSDLMTQVPQALRETNASSEQSFSIRGYSDFSVHGTDYSANSENEAPNEIDSSSDGYSTGDRYSTSSRFSLSSRLSSELGQSISGRFEHRNLDKYRLSSPSVLSRKQTPPRTNAPITKDNTTLRTDIPEWYNIIESPTDNDRYTTSTLESDKTSKGRESFEL